MIKIVTGVAVNDRNQVFLGRRREGREFEGCWETPGGKVEGVEYDGEALSREWSEELGVEISIKDLVLNAEFRNHPRPFYFRAYRIQIIGVPRMRDHQVIGWFAPGDFSPSMKFTPGTRLVINMLDQFKSGGEK